MTVLETADLACGYARGRPVLSDVSLEVAAGKTTVVVGPSGAGKTTLLRTVLGLVAPLTGRVRVCGADLPVRPPAGSVGYVPQGLGLVVHTSVLHNVLTGLLAETGRMRGILGVFPRAHVGRAREALAAVGLADAAHERPARLSGGQRRRVAVARALAQRPALLVADEILSELDETSAERVLDAVRDLQAEADTGVLIVEHDLDRSAEVADLLCCVGNGGLLAVLPPTPDRAAVAREVMAACDGWPAP